ncbi:PucR family transcriptional regulator ligand-binding domain-containing protein [Arthrobacter sp. JCM 19049]|uniref:PucR family transcriptional regulator ligand-binding domain-containing protein n=1 Tax=Arthrobacter sp. JCM 19049 TaxID=1460643 RepID=UPI0006D2586B|nr:PucR family transcriptional regulator ligand-binding domain-containing protein [Arthrobacter sp. JCM 19049]
MITLLQLGTELGRSFYPASGTTFRANPVTGVHISELADPTPYLEGGELLLTTGMSFADTAEASTEYLGRLAAHGITSLGLGLGPWLDEFPPGWRPAASGWASSWGWCPMRFPSSRFPAPTGG